MSNFKSNKLARITLVYWILLVYIVAALVWWFIALSMQNEQMAKLLLNELHPTDQNFTENSANIVDARNRKIAQYIGEGVTFLALILIGAVFVYRATRRQIRLSLQQQNFMMAVTHELKTPIAIAQLNLETLQKRKLEESQQQKLIANTLQEANRLNTLCNNILLASQLDAGAYKITKDEINFSEMVNAAVGEFKNRFPGRTLDAVVQDGIYIKGEELLLQMLINNLLDNALKYAPKDEEIRIILEAEINKISLTVADFGPGIIEEERKKIFEKFYRVGNESTRTAKGSGLGLFLCKRIANDHNGEIRVLNNVPVGTIFKVEFKS